MQTIFAQWVMSLHVTYSYHATASIHVNSLNHSGKLTLAKTTKLQYFITN